MTSRTLNARANAHVFLKCENFQRTGSFKFRGAFNALRQVPVDVAGVMSYSSGNHAQALARAGQILGIPVAVVMPHDAPGCKQVAVRAYEATIFPYDPDEQVREELARQLAEECNWPIIPPYDHAHIIAGQGTCAHEFIQTNSSITELLIPVGGGGLLSGSAIVAKALLPAINVVGVEPEQADDAARSFRLGKIQTVRNPDTIADGARTPYLGQLTFPIIRALVDDIVTVSEDAIKLAMRFLWERMKLIVEPTGALGIAAVLSGAYSAPGKRIGVIISGGNVNLDEAVCIMESRL